MGLGTYLLGTRVQKTEVSSQAYNGEGYNNTYTYTYTYLPLDIYRSLLLELSH